MLKEEAVEFGSSRCGATGHAQCLQNWAPCTECRCDRWGWSMGGKPVEIRGKTLKLPTHMRVKLKFLPPDSQGTFWPWCEPSIEALFSLQSSLLQQLLIGAAKKPVLLLRANLPTETPEVIKIITDHEITHFSRCQVKNWGEKLRKWSETRTEQDSHEAGGGRPHRAQKHLLRNTCLPPAKEDPEAISTSPQPSLWWEPLACWQIAQVFPVGS